MARMTFNAGEEYALKLSALAGDVADEMAKKAIYAGAGVVADEVRKGLTRVLSGESSGELLDSLGVTPVKADEKGGWNAKIGFDGYDENGVPNQLKARVLESGSSRQQKTPFMRPAVNASKKKAIKAMQEVIDAEFQKHMKG